MYTSSNIKSLSSARTVYNRLKSEPDFYRRKIEAMLNPEYLNIDFSKTKQYRNELITLSRTANNCADKMNTVINKINVSKNNDDKKEAEQLQTSFKKLSTDTKALANKIEGTENDFKQLDKSFQNKVPSFKIPTTKTSTLSGFGGFTVKTINRPGYLLGTDSSMSFNEAKNYSAKIENTSTIDQKTINNENKIDAMTPKTDAEKSAILAEKTAEIFNSLVDVNVDGSWASIDWEKVGALFEKGSVTESEYHALLKLYSEMKKTDDAFPAENIEKFISSAYVFSQYSSGYARGYGGSDSSFYASPILFCLESDMRDLAWNYLRIDESQLSDSSKETKGNLIMKSSILSDVLIHLPSVGFSDLGIPGGNWGKVSEKSTQGGGGSVYSVQASPNDTASFYNGFKGAYPIIRLETFVNGKYQLNVPRSGSGCSLGGWMSGKMNNGNWLTPITFAQEIIGYPVITDRIELANFSLDIYQDLATASRPNVQSISEYSQSITQTAVEGWVKGKAETVLVEYVILNSIAEGTAKTVGKEILTPLVSLPVDIAEAMVENHNNKQENIKIDNNIEKTSTMQNLIIVGGSYKATSTNGTLYLDDYYLPPGNLKKAAEIINKNHLNNSSQSIDAEYLNILLFEKAVHKDAINGAGFKDEMDADIYMYLISPEFDSEFNAE